MGSAALLRGAAPSPPEEARSLRPAAPPRRAATMSAILEAELDAERLRAAALREWNTRLVEEVAALKGSVQEADVRTLRR